MIFKMRSMSQKFNHLLSISQWCFCTSLVKIHFLVQEIECRQCSFYSLYSVVTLKFMSGSTKSNQIFTYSNNTKKRSFDFGDLYLVFKVTPAL